jgi:parallel beta-helix repeat protein
MNRHVITIFTSAIAALLVTSTTYAATWLVANDGVDSPTCGTAGSPCRSISQAVKNAAAGDTITVGPGRYGDLNSNGTFTDAGDEAAEVNTGCHCLVKVNKAVKVYSRDGADVTVLDAGGHNITVVDIQATGAIFGTKLKGFTLTGAGGSALQGAGLVIDANVNSVIVGGNRAVANATYGFYVNDNTASDQFIGNVAVANQGDGFAMSGVSHVFNGNAATANAGAGFNILSGSSLLFTHNVVVGNVQGLSDMSIDATSGTLTGNSFVGNRDVGILMSSSLFSITKNNIFGNVGAGGDNCGLENTTSPIAAPQNFFGAATGPGPAPANDVCVGTITTAPVGTKEIKVKTIAP